MDNKKKCGKAYFSLLLGVLFMLLFGMFSECYALTPVSDYTFEDFSTTIDVILNNGYFQSYKNWLTSFRNNSSKMNSAYNSVKNYLSSNNFEYLEHVTIVFDGNYSIYFMKNNNTIGNTLPFLQLNYSNPSSGVYTFYVKYIDDDKVGVSDNYIYLKITSDSYTVTSSNLGASNTLIHRTSNFSYNNSILYVQNIFSYNNPSTLYVFGYGLSGIPAWFWVTNQNVITLNHSVEPEPEPSGDDSSGDILPGGTITNSSGEVTGKVDLTNIENGITNINQNLNNIENKIPTSGDMQSIISGETSKITGVLTDSADDLIDNTTITSGDIEGALGFNFMADPYDNFWLQMTTGLGNALTNSVRRLPVDWLGYNGFFDLDVNGFSYPAPLENILTTVSTVCMVWILVKWWKIIIDKLTSGNVDEVLAMNEEERNSRFILGGVFMLEALFNFIIKIFFWLIGLIGSIIIYPIQVLLVALVPGLGDFISITLGFFNTYVWKYLSFMKELVLDASCLPRSLWSIFVTFMIARWAIAPAVRSIKLIINIWKVKSGGATK